MRQCHVLDSMNDIKASFLKQWIRKLASPVRVAVLAGALAVGASGLAWIYPSQATEERAAVTPVRLSVNEEPVSRDNSRGVTSFAPVVKKVTPSVVKVFVTGKAKNIPTTDLPRLEDPFFRRFFGDEFAPRRRMRGMISVGIERLVVGA